MLHGSVPLVPGLWLGRGTACLLALVARGFPAELILDSVTADMCLPSVTAVSSGAPDPSSPLQHSLDSTS